MKAFRFTYAVIFILLIGACSDSGLSEEEIATLNEAKTIHNEAYAIQGEVDEIMAQIAEHKNFMQVALSNNSESQDDEIAQGEVTKIKSLLLEIETLEEELINWKAELVEVDIPGEEEHDHEHDHEGHDHSHAGPDVEILPEQMLELQKEQRNIIQTIKVKAEQLKAQCQQYVNEAIETIE